MDVIVFMVAWSVGAKVWERLVRRHRRRIARHSSEERARLERLGLLNPPPVVPRRRP